MRYNNNTSSGHLRDNKRKNEAWYAEERKEKAWKDKLRNSQRP